MWASVPETEGVACGVGDPVEEALCRNPSLRGLRPIELARVLRTTPARAQMAILAAAGRATGTRLVFRGLSFDEAIMRAGRPAPPSSLYFSEDAAGIDVAASVGEKASSWIPPILAFLGLVAAALERPGEEP